MAFRNTILLQWASLKDSEKNHIDLLNDIIPGTVLRIKRDSKRMKERLRVTTIRLTGSLREKRMGKMDWTSLMGDERKKLLKNLLAKLESSKDSIHRNTAQTVIKMWKDFADIYFHTVSSLLPEQ